MTDKTGNNWWKRICASVTRLGSVERKAAPRHPFDLYGHTWDGNNPPPPPIRIDLHGLTLMAAWGKVKTFIEETPHREVTIITGKGQMASEIEDWLRQCPRYQSHRVMNGGGAFLARLRSI